MFDFQTCQTFCFHFDWFVSKEERKTHYTYICKLKWPNKDWHSNILVSHAEKRTVCHCVYANIQFYGVWERNFNELTLEGVWQKKQPSTKQQHTQPAKQTLKELHKLWQKKNCRYRMIEVWNETKCVKNSNEQRNYKKKKKEESTRLWRRKRDANRLKLGFKHTARWQLYNDKHTKDYYLAAAVAATTTTADAGCSCRGCSILCSLTPSCATNCIQETFTFFLLFKPINYMYVYVWMLWVMLWRSRLSSWPHFSKSNVQHTTMWL